MRPSIECWHIVPLLAANLLVASFQWQAASCTLVMSSGRCASLAVHKRNANLAESANQCAKSKVNSSSSCTGQEVGRGHGRGLQAEVVRVAARKCHASGKWRPQQSTTWLPLDFSVLVTMATRTHTHTDRYSQRRCGVWGHEEGGGGCQAVQWLSQAHRRQQRRGLALVSAPVSTSSIFISISIPFSISISNLHFIVNGPSMATCRITQHGYVT